MFNHSPAHIGQTKWEYCDLTKEFIVTAKQTIVQDAPIFEDYGDKLTYMYLYYYGFTFEPNRNNGVYINLYLNKTDPMVKTKSLLIGCTSETYYIKNFVYYKDFNMYYENNMEFLGYLRFIQFEGDADDLCQFLDPPVANISLCKAEKRTVKMHAISKKNETKALQKLREICNKCLNKYTTSYEEDIKLLAKKGWSYNEKNCIIYRMAEKKIFKDMLQLADLGLKLLSKKRSAAIKWYEGKVAYGKYIENIIIPLLK